MRTKIATLVVCLVLLVGVAPAFAQHNYMTLGQNPVVKGGFSVEEAKARGWQPYQLQSDTILTMYGARNESVTGWLPAGTQMALDSQGKERILECCNYTNRCVILQHVETTREKVVERLVEVPVVKKETVYVFGATVYPTAAMPQPQLQTFVTRSTVNFNVDAGGDKSNTFNLFGGNANAAGGAANAAGGAGGAGGDAINNNQNQNINDIGIGIGTNGGAGAGSAGGAGGQTIDQ